MIQQGLYVLVQVPATITPDSSWQCDAAITYFLRRCQWHVALCLSLRLALTVAVIALLTTVVVLKLLALLSSALLELYSWPSVLELLTRTTQSSWHKGWRSCAVS